VNNLFFLDLFVALISALSAYQIYKQEQNSLIHYLQLNPYLILLITVLLLGFTYFFLLRKKTIFECVKLIKSIKKNHAWILILLVFLIGGAFILSLRYEQRFEYVQIGKMQVLTPFMRDRWNGSIFWISPPKKPKHEKELNKKSWQKFPLGKFDKDIYGVWHPRFEP
tara:strand:+ start:488 stop:988 length:501 start_codon:yes stop_codon:yes gene_type:complete